MKNRDLIEKFLFIDKIVSSLCSRITLTTAHAQQVPMYFSFLYESIWDQSFEDIKLKAFDHATTMLPMTLEQRHESGFYSNQESKFEFSLGEFIGSKAFTLRTNNKNSVNLLARRFSRHPIRVNNLDSAFERISFFLRQGCIVSKFNRHYLAEILISSIIDIETEQAAQLEKCRCILEEIDSQYYDTISSETYWGWIDNLPIYSAMFAGISTYARRFKGVVAEKMYRLSDERKADLETFLEMDVFNVISSGVSEKLLNSSDRGKKQLLKYLHLGRRIIPKCVYNDILENLEIIADEKTLSDYQKVLLNDAPWQYLWIRNFNNGPGILECPVRLFDEQSFANVLEEIHDRHRKNVLDHAQVEAFQLNTKATQEKSQTRTISTRVDEVVNRKINTLDRLAGFASSHLIFPQKYTLLSEDGESILTTLRSFHANKKDISLLEGDALYLIGKFSSRDFVGNPESRRIIAISSVIVFASAVNKLISGKLNADIFISLRWCIDVIQSIDRNNCLIRIVSIIIGSFPPWLTIAADGNKLDTISRIGPSYIIERVFNQSGSDNLPSFVNFVVLINFLKYQSLDQTVFDILTNIRNKAFYSKLPERWIFLTFYIANQCMPSSPKTQSYSGEIPVT